MTHTTEEKPTNGENISHEMETIQMKLQEQINFLSSFMDKANFTKLEMDRLKEIRQQLERIKKGGRPKKWKSDQERWAYHNQRRASKKKQQV